MLAKGKKTTKVVSEEVEKKETVLDNTVKPVVAKNAITEEYKVTKRYEKHTSFMIGTYAIPVKNGKVRCSGKVKEMLLKGGFIIK